MDIDHAGSLVLHLRLHRSSQGVVHTHRTLQYSVLGSAVLNPELTTTRRDSLSFLGLSHVAPALSGVYAPIMTRAVVTFLPPWTSSPEAAPRRTSGGGSSGRRGCTRSCSAWRWPRSSRRRHRFQKSYENAMEVAREVAAARRRGERRARRAASALRPGPAAGVPALRAKLGVDCVNVAWTASGAMTPRCMHCGRCGVDLRELYGTTETCGWVLAAVGSRLPIPWDRRQGHARPAIRDQDQQRRGAAGEGPLLFRGYWNNPEATADVIGRVVSHRRPR